MKMTVLEALDVLKLKKVEFDSDEYLQAVEVLGEFVDRLFVVVNKGGV